MLGFPPMPELLTIGEKVYPEEIFEIESDWKQIVASPEVGYTFRASVFLLQNYVNSISDFASGICSCFRFKKFYFFPFQILKILFYFFQAILFCVYDICFKFMFLIIS